MGRGQHMSMYDFEKSVVTTPRTGFRSMVSMRRLVIVGLIAAFLPFVITSSYLYFTTPHASTEAMLFFQRLKDGASIPFFSNVTTVGDTNQAEVNAEAEADAMAEDAKANDLDPNETATHANENSPGQEQTSGITTAELYNSTSLGVNSSEPHLEMSEGNTTGIAMEGQGLTNITNSNNRDGCNLVKGSWMADPNPPQYTNSSCRFIQGHQNCMKNGRPDTGYLYWKWKPDQCDLPKIDARAFFTAMVNRSMTFAGDSIARNQFQSLLCLLSQVEAPDHTYQAPDDRDNIHVFRKYNFTLAIYWSPYLVHVEDKKITWPDNRTEIVAHIHVDKLDKAWTERLAGVDILQISTGQWWFKRALFLQDDQPIGGHICDGWAECKEIGFAKPYRLAMHKVLQKSLDSIPGYHGTTFLRTFAPDHFEGGAWDSGGGCVRTAPGGVPISYLTKWMYEIQIEEFQNVTAGLSASDNKRLRLLDITSLAQTRADGHPDAYMKFQPFSKEAKQPAQKDCLHWCLPGPIDTWNDLLVESLHDEIFA